MRHAAQVGRSPDEDALTASRAELGIILKALNTPVFVFDARGKVVYVNDAVARLMGAGDTGEILSMSHAEMLTRFEILETDLQPLTPEKSPSLRALKGEAVAGQLVRYRVRATGTDGWAMVKPCQGSLCSVQPAGVGAGPRGASAEGCAGWPD